MSKSAYEIRLDLLSLARDILEQQRYIESLDTEGNVCKKQVPVTQEEVIETAKKLNSFVSSSSS